MQSETILERIARAYPQALGADVEAALQKTALDERSISEPFLVNLNGETLQIPYRVYFAETLEIPIQTLTTTQQIIFGSLYTRHHNGRLREWWLRKIIESEEPWIPPFVLQLLSEYVVEITAVIAQNEERLKKEAYSNFIATNSEFAARVSQRILSYWAAYYRWNTPNYKDYIAYKVAKSIGLWRSRPIRKN